MSMDEQSRFDDADRAMAEQHADRLRTEEQIVLALRKSLTEPLTIDEAHLIAWHSGIEWRLVDPQRRAA
jgi:hypothetical protein